MLRPLSAITAVLATFAALTLTAAPAVAAETCSISFPARVQIAAPKTLITARLGADCAASDMAHAFWRIEPYRGLTFDFIAGETSNAQTFDTAFDDVGVLRAVPVQASSSTGNDIIQNSPSFPVKYATWAYVASSRAGSAVYINGLVKSYSDQGLVRGAGRTVYVQRYLNGAWQNMVARTTTSTGQFTVGFIQPKVYQYRLVAAENGIAWNGRSGSTFR